MYIYIEGDNVSGFKVEKVGVSSAIEINTLQLYIFQSIIELNQRQKHVIIVSRVVDAVYDRLFILETQSIGK